MTIIAQAPDAPIPLAELKAYLRIANSDEDALLASLARAAADMCESFSGRSLIVRALEETLSASAGWTRLGAAPVTAIDGVAALAADGASSPLAVGDYAVDIDAAGDGWVRLLRPLDEKRVRIAYRAGMAADSNGLPEALRHGILRLAAHFYLHRDAEAQAAPPAAVTALWRPWRRLRLG